MNQPTENVKLSLAHYTSVQRAIEMNKVFFEKISVVFVPKNLIISKQSIT